jgi:hypothetical protein
MLSLTISAIQLAPSCQGNGHAIKKSPIMEMGSGGVKSVINLWMNVTTDIYSSFRYRTILAYHG